jgi:hypothetical protein
MAKRMTEVLGPCCAVLGGVTGAGGGAFVGAIFAGPAGAVVGYAVGLVGGFIGGVLGASGLRALQRPSWKRTLRSPGTS